MEESPAIEDPPHPPPVPPLRLRELESSALGSRQDSIPQDFQRIIVHGKAKSPERRRRSAFKPSDQHLPTARLKLFCFDKTTGKPLQNVQVQLKAMPGNDPDRVVAKTVSNAFGNRAVSRKDGYVICKVLAGYPYRIAATAAGYHDFGHMGENLLLTPQKDTEMTGDVGMVPVRISVVVTLRELRPLHTPESLQGDTTGQVNALLSLPRAEQKGSVPSQKVSFYSSEGIKMDFVATTVERDDVLVGWPASLGVSAEAATCSLGVYSTDANGHCFFYGPKIVNKRSNTRKAREWMAIDVGRWEYACKYHLRTNQESPVFLLFDGFKRTIEYPAHVARYPPRGMRSPSPNRGTSALMGRSRQELMKSFLQDAVEAVAVSSADPNEPDADTEASGPAKQNGSTREAGHADTGADNNGAAGSSSSAQRRATSPAPLLRSRPSTPIAAIGGAGNNRPDSAVSRSQSAPRHSRQSADPDGEREGDSDTLGHADLLQELKAYTDSNIHNYVDPGQYRLQMKDPSRLLIFYTYSGDGEAAEINRAQNAVVPFNMHSSDESFIHPRDGSLLRPTNFPVQLYCRARPWFQIAVYDMATLEEVGSLYSFEFKIERLTTTVVSGRSTGRTREGDAPGATRRRRNASDEDSPFDYIASFLESQGKDDSKVYPYKLMDVEETSVELFRGVLGEARDKMWMTPGEKYRVTVNIRSPFMDYNAVQVRTANWELEPFVFYAVKKVVLLVEVRERYNQLPIPNTEVIVEVREPPQAPRPPAVKPEWCEDPKAYAHRVLDQIVDYVVQNNRERVAATQSEVTVHRGFTDADGLVSFELPPEARVYIRAVNSNDFEDTEASREVQLSSLQQQFALFQLERVTRTATVVLDSETNQGVAGFELRAYDITEYTDMPRDGTRKVRHLLDTVYLDTIDTSTMEPFAVETTGPDGAVNTPFCRRAGRVIKIEVSKTPRTHHMPSLVMSRGKNSTFVVTYDRQSAVFKAPPRPRIKVCCIDTCTFEEVCGVRFRVMVRTYEPAPADSPSGSTRRSARRSAPISSQPGSRSVSFLGCQSQDQKTPFDVATAAQAVDDDVVHIGVEMELSEPLGPEDSAAPASPDVNQVIVEDYPSPSVSQAGSRAPSRVQRTLGHQLSPVPEAGVPPLSRESSSVSTLREQHKQTLAEVDKLERGYELVKAQYEAEHTDALALQKQQLETLLAQLRGVMDEQQRRLDALIQLEDTKFRASAPSKSGAKGERHHVVIADAPQEEDTKAADKESVTSQNRPRESAGPTAMFGAGLSSVFDAFGGVGRMLSNRGRAEGDEDEDEEEALRKLRAAEEEMMAVFNPAPEELDPWGRIVWDSVTGHEENEDLIIDADCEIAVQIFPGWPFDPRSQMLKGRCEGHVGPAEFRFYLPRDGNAFRFWLDRDIALPGFFDSNCNPTVPYHSLARLQPMAPPCHIVSKPHPEMKLLRPASYDPEEEMGDPSLPRHEWTPRLQLFHNFPPLTTTNPQYSFNGSKTSTANQALVAANRLYLLNNGSNRDGPGVGESFLGAPLDFSDIAGYEFHSVRPDGSRILHRTVSAIQFDPSDNSDDINDLAWQQLRLSDASYLPLERTRLLQFLTRWGSFPHVAGGHCRACSGMERSPDSNPLLLAEAPPTPRFQGEVPQVGFGVGFSAASGWSRSGATGSGADDGAQANWGGISVDGGPGQRGPGGMTFKSRLLPSRELSAVWVFENRPPPRPEGPPVRRCVPDRFSRTHVIVKDSQAVYCRSPFFTWWLPNGGGVHVTMSTGLYRELIPLIDSVAVSLEYMDQHLEKVRMLNEGRCQQGRFLLGHQVVDSFCGGVFIIDVSTAQPFSGVSFILEQLSKTFDYWATETPMGHPRPRFNILLCSREVIECWRSALGTVNSNMAKRLLPWYEDIKYKMPTAPGFNMVKALRTAGAMAKSETPIFLLCGGLVESPLNTPSEMSKVLYEMQLACLNSQAPMQPVVAVELFPMPQARMEMISRVKTTTTSGEEQEMTEKRSAPLRTGADDASEISVEEAATMGSNIFALLGESLTAGRIRLLEVFREVDKDADGALDWQQLYRLVLKLVPDTTPAHVRYVQLLLDCTGDNLVRYKDLAAAVRACGRGGISVALRDKLEVQLVLHKMAINMLLGKITPGEMFAHYDLDKDGFWSEKELSNMLKDLFPSLRPAEHQLLFDAWKGVDKNQDGRISLDEFTRAFSSGGVPGLPGSSILSHPDQIQRMKEAGELDDFTIMAMKATEENKRLDKVRAVGFPLSETLVRVAGATRGTHRRLDLGRARAFADRIDLKPLEAVRESLANNLSQLLQFEKAYGKQLTYEHQYGKAVRMARGSGSLTADPPTPAASSSRMGRPSSARTRSARGDSFGTGGGAGGNSGTPFAATSGASAAATATASNGSNASPARPRSAIRTRPSSRPRSAMPSISGGSNGRQDSAAVGSGGGASRASSSRGARPSSATRSRPAVSAAWMASAHASDDPHLRKLAREASTEQNQQISPGDAGASAGGSQPWQTGPHSGGGSGASGGGGLSRELSQRSSLLAGLNTGEDDPRLRGRQEYRPPSERSFQRPRGSYGSRTSGPSAEPSGASIGGEDGGNNEATSRPSSAPARRRSNAAPGGESVSASVAMPPLAFTRLPSGAMRKSLPLKIATLGFDVDEADNSGLPFISPDPNAPPLGAHGSGGGARPMSGRRSMRVP